MVTASRSSPRTITALIVLVGLVAAGARTGHAAQSDALSAIKRSAPEVLADNDATVRLPDDLRDGYMISTADGPVKILVTSANAPATVIEQGVRSYGNLEKRTETVLAGDRSGEVRVLKVLAGRQAPTSFQFEVADPAVSLNIAPTGHVMLSKSGRGIGAISPPWAYDANRRPIPTYYTVTGRTFTLHVAHDQPGTAYPVVADPIPAIIILWGLRFALSAIVGWGMRAWFQSRGYICPWWASVWLVWIACYQRVY